MTIPSWKPVDGSGRAERQTRRRARAIIKERTAKRLKAEARRQDRAVRFACFLRDGRQCRAFGTPLKFETDLLAVLAHNHHITYRSAGGSDESANRVTLSPFAHRLEHEGLLEIGGNADETLTFTRYEWAGGTRQFVRAWSRTV